MMTNNKLDKLPKKLQSELKQLDALSAQGWSKEWQEHANHIMEQLLILRESNLLSQSDFDDIHVNYLKSIGKISENNYTFFNFLIQRD